MSDNLVELGPNARIDPDVTLGYQYPGNTKPLVLIPSPVPIQFPRSNFCDRAPTYPR